MRHWIMASYERKPRNLIKQLQQRIQDDKDNPDDLQHLSDESSTSAEFQANKAWLHHFLRDLFSSLCHSMAAAGSADHAAAMEWHR